MTEHTVRRLLLVRFVEVAGFHLLDHFQGAFLATARFARRKLLAGLFVVFGGHVGLQDFVFRLLVVLFVIEEFVLLGIDFLFGTGGGIIVDVSGYVGTGGVNDFYLGAIDVGDDIVQGAGVEGNDAFGHVPRNIDDLGTHEGGCIANNAFGLQPPRSVDGIVTSVGIASTPWLVGHGMIVFVVMRLGEGVEIDRGEWIGGDVGCDAVGIGYGGGCVGCSSGSFLFFGGACCK
mmetsp:Transcript_31565/g.66835  ORF Transcript_31565/g.66835 Transcript_31565/m.66835 type:complete len:232 (+) Transcript_31565:674-1369(+)